MSDLYDSVKRKIGQVVVSCPKFLKMTIPALQRDYQSVNGHPIPYRKFSHRDLLSLLKEMDDMIEIKEDADTGGIYLQYKRGYNKIMDNRRAIILKDKLPSDAKKQMQRNVRELQESSCQDSIFIRHMKERPPEVPRSPQFPPAVQFLERVVKLIEGSGEVWAFNLPELYRKQYGVELPLNIYKYSDPGKLVEDLEKKGLIRLERSRMSNNHKVYPKKSQIQMQSILGAVGDSPPARKVVLEQLEEMLTQRVFCIAASKIRTFFSKYFPTRNLNDVFPSYVGFLQILRENMFSFIETSDEGEFVLAPPDHKMPSVALHAPKQLYLDTEQRENFTALVMNIKSLSYIHVMWEDDCRKFQISSADLGNCLENKKFNGLWAYTPRKLYQGQLLAVRNNSGIWERATVLKVTGDCLLCLSFDVGTEIRVDFPLRPQSVQLLPAEFCIEPVFSRIVSIQCLPTILNNNKQLAVRALNEILSNSRYVRVMPSSDPGAHISDKTTLVGLQILNESTGCYHDVRAILSRMVQDSLKIL